MRRLVTDAMLGRLTTYLRMCGHDTVYAPDADLESDGEIRGFAREEDRELLTRDVELAAATEDSLLLESKEIRPQLRELRETGFELRLPDTPERCSACNGSVERVSGDEQPPEYAPDPVSTPLWRCRACGQYFWKGSHWDDVARTLDTV